MSGTQGATQELWRLFQRNEVDSQFTLSLEDDAGVQQPVPDWATAVVEVTIITQHGILVLSSAGVSPAVVLEPQVPALTGDTVVTVTVTEAQSGAPAAGNYTVDVITAAQPRLTYRYGAFEIVRTLPGLGTVSGWSMSELTLHLTDTSDAHDASAISISDAAGDFTATDVEGALAELQTFDETLPGTYALRVPTWVTARDYILNELVLNAGILYRVSTAHTSAESFDATKFEAITGEASGDYVEVPAGTPVVGDILVVTDDVPLTFGWASIDDTVTSADLPYDPTGNTYLTGNDAQEALDQADATLVTLAAGTTPTADFFAIHANGRHHSHTTFSTHAIATSDYTNGRRSTTGAQNSEVVFLLPTVLRAGTWALTLLHRQGTDTGIYTIAVSPDATTWTDLGTTIDGYNASAVSTRSEITGQTIAANMKYLRLTMATKNASSSDYYGRINHISGSRTGA